MAGDATRAIEFAVDVLGLLRAVGTLMEPCAGSCTS
ncbi:Uncharacterised protein [Mycobacteroides abscessus subsp. abscessus]|nr:Uncharacterised protein [Mycobacteroides abscessus subsp. abscessus]